jgi:hypothetical protein
MPSPAVTHVFSNGTAADATQVNTNFSDLINGMTDGTKDFSINALTLAGTFTGNGNCTFGNASSDDITFTGSLASSIPIKTTNTPSIGSATLGLNTLYFGNGTNSNTVALKGGVTSSSYTLTLPTTAGTSGHVMQTNGSGTTSWRNVAGPGTITNVSLAASVGSSALTISLKGADGNDPSSTNAVYASFRNSTAATGTFTERTATSGVSLTISSGSTLGHSSGNDHFIYVYLIDNAGTIELAASSCIFDEGSLVSTTAEGGAGAADSNRVIYSTTARTNVACRLVGRIKSNQATAGTWATTPSEISLIPFLDLVPSACYLAGTQTFEAATAGEIVAFITKRFDNMNAMNTSTGVYTATRAGKYRVSANVLFASGTWAASNFIEMQIRVGASMKISNILRIQAAITALIGHQVSGTVDCVLGDEIDVFIDHNRTAGDISFDGTAGYEVLNIEWVGP